jgi:hypothetical protein
VFAFSCTLKSLQLGEGERQMYNELSGWNGEMLDCAKVDSRHETRYANTMGENQRRTVITG